ncbi:putative lipoprotein [Streptomyces fructofermentans]|uniref:Lipoprotein n=1 Tax=Streptomyces fructofermentans TaxID=152141 RepID=A0A918KKE3_9ACTN|nr:putative lipoprotein [Streptomyces fructofermentans]
MTVLSVTAGGCVVVHGEREVLPGATRTEAARALKDFSTAYNEANAANDPTLDADRVTGALGDIDGAKLKAGGSNQPGGNPGYLPLKLTGTEFTIPEKAGWPRWFVTESKANKGRDEDRWLLVFTRGGPDEVWEVSYLTILPGADIPEFAKDADGWAQAVAPDAADLAVAPRALPKAYAAYLRDGGDTFAPGTHTTKWRSDRTKNASRPGLAQQYIDEPLTSGDYAPVALRTADGGALVFFTTRHYQRQTSARGVPIDVTNTDVKALMTGEPKQSLTLESVSNQAVLDPAKGAADRQVRFLGRIQGLTGAKGE